MLKRMGFSSSTYVEAVVLLFKDGRFMNVVPLGIKLKNGVFIIRIFKGSRTYKLVAEGMVDSGRICLTNEATAFYLAMFKKEEAMGILKKFCDAFIDFEIINVEPKKNYVVLYGEPKSLEIVDRMPKGFTRASAAIIEAMVWLSKIPYIDKERRSIYENYVRMCIETVYRSSRSKRYRAIARDIVNRLENMISSSFSS